MNTTLILVALYGSLILAGMLYLTHRVIGIKAACKVIWYWLTTNHKRK